MSNSSILLTSWELAFTLLDKLDHDRGLAGSLLGISIHPDNARDFAQIG